MIIKLVGGPYQRTTGRIDCEMCQVLDRMGLSTSLSPSGSIRLSGVFSSKQADGPWIPTPPILGRGEWPTIVLEVGVSVTYQKVKADAA